jgi:hypothetical protein
MTLFCFLFDVPVIAFPTAMVCDTILLSVAMLTGVIHR